MWRLGWGVEGQRSRWIMRLIAWEEEQVEKCVSLLDNIIMQDRVTYSWTWRYDPVDD